MTVDHIDSAARGFPADASSGEDLSQATHMDSLPALRDARAYGFFFDFDGTLAEIAETPSAVIVEDRARHALASLLRVSSGAVAIVTGREIDAIDSFFVPLRLPVAGVHGYERRNGGMMISAQHSDEESSRAFEGMLRSFVSHNPGLLLEKKRGALALHYRLRPELETLCVALVEDSSSHLSSVVLTRGKMVIEARLHTANKGTAISDFLREPPFCGRVPFFAGDDVTDEDAFATVNALGGISIKVGPGKTTAKARAGSVDEFLSWLLVTIEMLEGTCEDG
jgi:trehalose 6-phosphate phosphatase